MRNCKLLNLEAKQIDDCVGKAEKLLPLKLNVLYQYARTRDPQFTINNIKVFWKATELSFTLCPLEMYHEQKRAWCE